MFKGLRTTIYHVPDIDRAKEWYKEVLGFPPYFEQPFYVGFNIGGFELGLQPDSPPTPAQSHSVVTYWGVSEIESDYKRLLSLGAIPYSEVQSVGDGIRVATVIDPFGNILGIIENPHISLK